MNAYVVALITLSALKPCPPASVPVHGCLDYVTRMSGPISLARCETDVAWWRKHIRETERETDDTGAAICVRAPVLREH